MHFGDFNEATLKFIKIFTYPLIPAPEIFPSADPRPSKTMPDFRRVGVWDQRGLTERKIRRYCVEY